MTRKLTKRDVDGFRFPHGETTKTGKPLAQAFLWDIGDGSVKGFGLRLTPNGKKTYVVQGRVKGKLLRLTLGQHSIFTVDQAREQAKEYLRRMRRGKDPRDLRRQDEAAKVTLHDAAEAHIADPRRPHPIKPSAAAAIRRHVDTTFKAWKKKPLIDISEQMCRQRFNDHCKYGLHGKANPRKGGAKGQALQSMSVLQAIFNFAIDEYKLADGSPLITINPAVMRKKPKLGSRKHRWIREKRIGHVWTWLTTTREQAYDRVALSSIDLAMFMLLTGCRVDEARSLTWDRVSLDEAWWTLPDPKNRTAIWYPLSSQAVELLKERPRVRGNEYVFPGRNRKTHIKDPRGLWERIKAVAELNEFSAHDCRRTYTTLALSQVGIDYFKVQLLTGHKLPGVVAGHYFDTEDLRWLASEQQRYADFIDEAAARASGENVIPMRA